jgi:type II secretory pathway component PulK
MRLRRKGFALYTAVMIGMLITGVIAALTMGLASDVKRTSLLRHDAQMAQLLLSGMHLAEAKLDEGSLKLGDSIDLSVPEELDAKVQLKANLVSSSLCDVTVTAHLAGKQQQQHLKLQPVNHHWRTTSAELE